MITHDAFTIGKMVINSVLTKLKNIPKKQIEFLEEILLLLMSMRGRRNFLQMSREGSRTEKSFRYQFEKTFDWLTFNIELVKMYSSTEIVIGFDPSHIKKSGKHSHGIGHFYSGCQGRFTKGLELGNFAALDKAQHTAYHLEAVQSPSAKRDRIDETKTLIDHYGDIVIAKSEKLRELSNTLVCDAYFTKKKFIDKVCDEGGFEVIGRMRDDANLRYIFRGKQKRGRGRRRMYDGKINNKNIDKRRIQLVREDADCKIYSAIVNSVGLKRNIRIIHVEHMMKNRMVRKIYYSTNINRDPVELLNYYRLRFQMEFLFRDGKQHMGLENCQARSKNKLHFHFNASLTAVSIGKVISRYGKHLREIVPFSLSDIKTELQNRNMLYRIFSMYRFDWNLIKINSQYRNLINFGKIAA